LVFQACVITVVIVSLFSVESREHAMMGDGSAAADDEHHPARPVGERLVRVPIEELEEQAREQQQDRA
jgi:hypothetical protein